MVGGYAILNFLSTLLNSVWIGVLCYHPFVCSIGNCRMGWTVKKKHNLNMVMISSPSSELSVMIRRRYVYDIDIERDMLCINNQIKLSPVSNCNSLNNFKLRFKIVFHVQPLMDCQLISMSLRNFTCQKALIYLYILLYETVPTYFCIGH